MLSSAAGAALGAGARYVLPTKAEKTALKAAKDTFFSSANVAARGNGRSILKYGGIGAILAGGLYLLSKFFENKKIEDSKYIDSFEYAKYADLIEAPGIACELFWYGD